MMIATVLTVLFSISKHNNRRGSFSSGSIPAAVPEGAGGTTKTANDLEFLDCNHHFYNTRENEFQSFLNRFNPDATYLPSDYRRDVVEPIETSQVLRDRMIRTTRGRVKHVGSVHVESMPDDGLEEAKWVMESLVQGTDNDDDCCTVKAIVASCFLADDEETVNRKLRELKEYSPNMIRGVRWILDCVGNRLEGNTVVNPATHVGNLRHDGIDYLRDPDHRPDFERGYALLERHGFSFDLQCAPAQLTAAAELCSRYPNIPVVIDHLGKPMHLFGENNSLMVPDAKKLDEWRIGVKAMADNCPHHAFVKISGLGWAVPNWTRSARRVDVVRKLCQETVEMFGPERCMINTNWWKDAASSDSDGLGDDGPTADEYLEYMLDFFGGLTPTEQRMLFSGTAKKFYRI